MHIGIGIRIGKSSGSNWTPQSLGSKALGWFREVDEVGGHQPNKMKGASDYLTVVSGSSLNKVYALPDTTPYINADTDKAWYKTGHTIGDIATVGVTDGNRLIAYDFARTIIKYDNISPYALRETIILSQALTTDEMNHLRDYAQLSIWWDNVSSIHGAVKDNRIGEQSIWTPESVGSVPVVTTTEITSVLDTTVSGGGNVTDDGGGTVSARGVCWSISANPTISDSKSSDGTGTGVFTSSLTGLTGATVYHVRAYATNEFGTSYGSDVQFETLTLYDTFTDTDAVLLHNHTMNLGAGWTELTHTWSILGNKLLAEILSDTSGKAICEGGKTNFELSIDYQMPSTIAKKHASFLFFRYADLNNYMTFGIECDIINHPYIYMAKNVSGTPTDIFRITDYLSHAGDIVNLRVNVNNNVINCYVNSDLISIPHTVSDLSANTKVGLLQYATGVIGSGLYEQLPFDNFKLRGL